MKQNFAEIASALEGLHRHYEEENGRDAAFKLGSKGLAKVFRVAAEHRTRRTDIEAFAVKTETDQRQNAFISLIEKRLHRMGYRAHIISRIREATGQGLEGGADAAWDQLVHSMRLTQHHSRYRR